jgi:DNA-binding response OmpR family regulator
MRSGVESPVRILIVDDDQISREILREAIDQKGVAISLSPDGANALEMLADASFDILITDLNMPNMNGLTLLREARQRFPHLMVIIITGYGTLESAIEALRQGAYDYVQKPFKMEEMAITARNAVQAILMMRERKRILEELDSTRRLLRKLEERVSADKQDGLLDKEEVSLLIDTYLASHRILPLAFLEKSAEDGASSILTDLERLRDLKARGIITDREFEELKKSILDRVR